MSREFWANVGEVVGGILFMILVVILFWLYLIVTPDQYSAECEYQRAQMHDGVRNERDLH